MFSFFNRKDTSKKVQIEEVKSSVEQPQQNNQYSLLPINNLMLVKFPNDWTHQIGDKFRASNSDNTITLTISFYEKGQVEGTEQQFNKNSINYFATFDKHYKPVSEIIKEDRVLLKLYNTGKTLEYHAITYVQPMLTRFMIVCFVFTSIRNLEDSDIKIFETITSSLTYKVSELP